MKALTSHNYRLEELPLLRNYNAKTFRTEKTREAWFYLPSGKKVTAYSGQLLTEFHVKPIHYIGSDGKWHDLDEIASYFGNRNGMVLKEGWEKRMNFSYLVWYMKRQQLISGRGVRIGYPSTYLGIPVGRIELPMMLNTVTTVYPDPDPETTSVDGTAYRLLTLGSGEIWATIIAGAGTGAGSVDVANDIVGFESDNVSSQWIFLRRSFFLFDASSIPDGDTIDSATLSGEGSGKSDALAITPNINIYSSAPATNTNLVAGDFTTLGSTAFSTAITYANWSTTAYNDFALNASGLANISKTTVSKFGGRNPSYDVAPSTPAWSSNLTSTVTVKFADTAGTTSDPKLAVTHSSAVNAFLLNQAASAAHGL